MNLKELNVLVIDDQALMRDLIAALLNQMLISKVTAVESPVLAASLLRAGKTYDIALVDWEMRPVSGIEFVKALRHGVFGAMKKMPVLMVTGHPDQERVIASKEAGVNGFLVKPIDGVKLLASIQAILDPPKKKRPPGINAA